MKKRIICMWLLLLLLLNIYPAITVSAAEDEWIWISNASELYSAINSNKSGKFKLANDINLSAYGVWKPIGTKSNPFKGTLDGNGYSIFNLSLSSGSGSEYTGSLNIGHTWVGLFGYATNSNIFNLKITISSCNAKGNSYVYCGGLIGYDVGSKINNVSVSGSRLLASPGTSTWNYHGGSVGGIIGIASSTTVLNNVHNSCSVSIDGDLYDVYAGGITGKGGIISRSTNKGSIYATGDCSDGYVGGISGIDATISECRNTGYISFSSSCQYGSGTYSGGIAGSSNSVTNCYNTGSVSCSIRKGNYYETAGGICGKGTNITNCYNIGTVSADCTKERKNYISGVGVVSNEDMTTPSKYKDFDFKNVWLIDNTNGYVYPKLRAFDDRGYEIIYKGIAYDLLSQPINIDKESNADVTVKVNCKSSSTYEKIYITQNAENFIELEKGVEKTFKPTDVFDVDKDIYILVINTKTGDSYSERTKLKIVEKLANGDFMSTGNVDGLNFKLGKKISFTIPSDIAVFGGTEIKWDFGFIPISVEYDREDDNKINLVFGTNLIHTDDEEDKFFKDFDFKKYKDRMKKLTAEGRTLKQLRNDFKMSSAYKMNLFGGNVIGGSTGNPSFDYDLAGYAEMKVINGELKFIEGQICVEAEASYTYQGQLFIWTVPLYYEIGGGVGIGFEGDVINISPEIFIPELEAYLIAKVKANIGAGFGIAKVTTIGASGEGSLNIKSALNKDYLKAWGEGEADFNVKVLGKEVAKKTFAKGDFLIYETGNANGLIKDSDIVVIGDESGSGNGGGGGGSISAMSASTAETLYSAFNNISRSDTYENESRAYASSSTEWYGDMPPISLFDAEYTSKNLRLLAENVYTESAPIMCDIGGQKVMVMLWDNSERDDINRTMLVYSVYDDSEGIWSAPLPVCDDGTADFYPNFNDGYLVWQNEKSLLDDSMSLGDIAKLGEICVSKWNGNAFDTPVVLTDNDTLDTQPVVCASESEVSVIWTTNSENDILGLSGDNSIVKSSLIGSDWSEPEVVKQGLNTITNLSSGYTADGLNIAYVQDADGDLQTIDDRDISIISDSGEYKLTDNDVLDSNPQIKGDKIYYYSVGNIEYRVLGSEETKTVFADAKAGLTDNFSVSESSNGGAVILWAKSTDGVTEIFSTIYNDGKWSDEIQISETGNQSKYPTAVLEDDGSIYIAYNNGILTDGEITQTDLYVIDLTPSYDLSVSDANIDEDTMTVFAAVKNSGELNIDSYTVSLIDNGNVNSKLTVSDGLKAGESAEVEIKYIKPSDLTKHTITLSIETENDEYNTANNLAELIVGNCDVEIKDIQNYEILPTSVAVATINNNGYSDTGIVTIKLCKDKANGEVIDTQTISNISAGASSEVTFKYNIIENDNIQWYITAETENDEISLGNNDSYFINNCLSGLSEYSQEILRYNITDDKLVVNGYVENNTATDLSGVSVLAVYDSKGTLKALTNSDTYVYKYDSTSVDLTIDGYTHENGDYIKLLLWTDLKSIVPVCEAEYSTVIKE